MAAKLSHVLNIALTIWTKNKTGCLFSNSSLARVHSTKWFYRNTQHPRPLPTLTGESWLELFLCYELEMVIFIVGSSLRVHASTL